MRDKKRLLIVFAACLAMALAVPALAAGQATRTETPQMEGEAVTFEANEYWAEGLFSPWYDAQNFEPATTEEGVLPGYRPCSGMTAKISRSPSPVLARLCQAPFGQ